MYQLHVNSLPMIIVHDLSTVVIYFDFLFFTVVWVPWEVAIGLEAFACETCPLGALPCLHGDFTGISHLGQQCVGGSRIRRVTLGLGTSFSRLIFTYYIRKWTKKSSRKASRNLLLSFGVCSLASLFVVSIRTHRLSLRVFATGEYR